MQGDCRDVMAEMPSDIIDLIVTSPPYADQRASTYGGTDPDHYVDWLVPIADEMQRVLKPTGSLILNIKEHAVSGERHPYVIELIREMRHSGWFWTEEYIWHKKNSYPGNGQIGSATPGNAACISPNSVNLRCTRMPYASP